MLLFLLCVLSAFCCFCCRFWGRRPLNPPWPLLTFRKCQEQICNVSQKSLWSLVSQKIILYPKKIASPCGAWIHALRQSRRVVRTRIWPLFLRLLELESHLSVLVSPEECKCAVLLGDDFSASWFDIGFLCQSAEAWGISHISTRGGLHGRIPWAFAHALLRVLRGVLLLPQFAAFCAFHPVGREYFSARCGKNTSSFVSQHHHHHHLRSHIGSSKTSCRSFYKGRNQGNHRKGTLFIERCSGVCWCVFRDGVLEHPLFVWCAPGDHWVRHCSQTCWVKLS